MGSSTVPTHGKLGAIYRKRPNNFKGTGLNDLTWGLLYNGAASGYFEVVIDALATPDTFKWRKNGGSWTNGVAITGSAQTLSDLVTVTFATTTLHTLTDQWTQGNLAAEPCSSVAMTAQVTDATKRLLNPSATFVWTDSGGAKLLWMDYSSGTGYFDKNTGTVTLAAKDGYIVMTGLQKFGYLIDWNFTVTIDVADITSMGDKWKTNLVGLAGGSGGSNGFFLGSQTLLDELLAEVTAVQKQVVLQLFHWDKDQDQTGDHWQAWALFTSISEKFPIGAPVQEATSFTLFGKPCFVADA